MGEPPGQVKTRVPPDLAKAIFGLAEDPETTRKPEPLIAVTLWALYMPFGCAISLMKSAGTGDWAPAVSKSR